MLGRLFAKQCKDTFADYVETVNDFPSIPLGESKDALACAMRLVKNNAVAMTGDDIRQLSATLRHLTYFWGVAKSDDARAPDARKLFLGLLAGVMTHLSKGDWSASVGVSRFVLRVRSKMDYLTSIRKDATASKIAAMKIKINPNVSVNSSPRSSRSS